MSYDSEKSSGSVSESSGSGSVGSGSDSGGTSVFSTDGGSSSDSGFSSYHGFSMTTRLSGLRLPADDLFGVVKFGEEEMWYGGFRQTA